MEIEEQETYEAAIKLLQEATDEYQTVMNKLVRRLASRLVWSQWRPRGDLRLVTALYCPDAGYPC